MTATGRLIEEIIEPTIERMIRLLRSVRCDPADETNACTILRKGGFSDIEIAELGPQALTVLRVRRSA